MDLEQRILDLERAVAKLQGGPQPAPDVCHCCSAVRCGLCPCHEDAKPSAEKDKCFKCSDCGEEDLTLWEHTYEHKNGKCKPSAKRCGCKCQADDLQACWKCIDTSCQRSLVVVEEKIVEIINWVKDGKELSRNDLCELVRLARQGK